MRFFQITLLPVRLWKKCCQIKAGRNKNAIRTTDSVYKRRIYEIKTTQRIARELQEYCTIDSVYALGEMRNEKPQNDKAC